MMIKSASLAFSYYSLMKSADAIGIAGSVGKLMVDRYNYCLVVIIGFHHIIINVIGLC